MIMLVCGGRDYGDKEAVWAALDAVHARRPITLLIAGGAPGADTLAEKWAIANDVPTQIDHADWKNLDAPGAMIRTGKYGKYNARAGHDRNVKMLSRDPDGVTAFPGGSGTADMVKLSRAAGKTVWQPYGE